MASIFQLTEWPLPATYLFEQHADALSAKLRSRFPSTDPQAVYDAVIDAILDISKKIEQLQDPHDLGGLLYVAALRGVLGMRRRDDARQNREFKKGEEFVAKQADAARLEGTSVDQGEILDRVFREVPENDDERTVLKHWGASTTQLAETLGMQALSPDEQRKLIKPIRDRLAKRLERFLN